MSCIYQDPKSKIYMVKVSVLGKTKTRSLKTKDRRIAVARAKSVETKLFLEFYNPVKPNNHATKDEIFERFIAHKQKQNRSLNTLSIYRKCWLNYTQKRLDNLSFEYRKLHYRHLSAIFNFAIDNGLATENPFKKLPKTTTPVISYYSDTEAKTIFNRLPDNRFGDTMKLFFLTGMRLGEMVNLKREEILSDKIILHGKTGRRTIPTTPPIRDILQRDRIFDWKYNTLSDAMRREGFSATKIRHTFATTLVKKGISIYIVSKLLGHKSVKTTETYYAHLAPEEIKNHTEWLGW